MVTRLLAGIIHPGLELFLELSDGPSRPIVSHIEQQRVLSRGERQAQVGLHRTTIIGSRRILGKLRVGERQREMVLWLARTSRDQRAGKRVHPIGRLPGRVEPAGVALVSGLVEKNRDKFISNVRFLSWVFEPPGDRAQHRVALARPRRWLIALRIPN